jgi:hypothetical protein
MGAVQTISGQAVIDSKRSGADKLLVEVYSVETVQKIFRDLNTNIGCYQLRGRMQQLLCGRGMPA